MNAPATRIFLFCSLPLLALVLAGGGRAHGDAGGVEAEAHGDAGGVEAEAHGDAGGAEAEAHGDAGGAEAEAHEAAAPPYAPAFEPPAPGSYELPVIQKVGRHQLLDADGSDAPLLALGAGQLALVSFVFLSCGHACPQATATLQRLDRMLVERGLESKVELVTVSFDPARDRPEQMARQRNALHPKGRWRFLTARDQPAIDEVLGDFGQHVGVWLDPDGKAAPQLDHVLKVFLVDAEGGVRNIYSTGYLDPRLMLNDVLTVSADG